MVVADAIFGHADVIFYGGESVSHILLCVMKFGAMTPCVGVHAQLFTRHTSTGQWTHLRMNACV